MLFPALLNLNSRQTRLLKLTTYTLLLPAFLLLFMPNLSLGLHYTLILRNGYVPDIVIPETSRSRPAEVTSERSPGLDEEVWVKDREPTGHGCPSKENGSEVLGGRVAVGKNPASVAANECSP